MTRKSHDADLCERIRQLEERVRELEARPHTTVVPAYPWWEVAPSIPNPYPWSPWYSGTTITYAKGVSTDSTTYTVGDIS